MMPQSDVAFDGVHDEITKSLLMFSGRWKYNMFSNLSVFIILCLTIIIFLLVATVLPMLAL